MGSIGSRGPACRGCFGSSLSPLLTGQRSGRNKGAGGAEWRCVKGLPCRPSGQLARKASGTAPGAGITRAHAVPRLRVPSAHTVGPAEGAQELVEDGTPPLSDTRSARAAGRTAVRPALSPRSPHRGHTRSGAPRCARDAQPDRSHRLRSCGVGRRGPPSAWIWCGLIAVGLLLDYAAVPLPLSRPSSRPATLNARFRGLSRTVELTQYGPDPTTRCGHRHAGGGRRLRVSG